MIKSVISHIDFFNIKFTLNFENISCYSTRIFLIATLLVMAIKLNFKNS